MNSNDPYFHRTTIAADREEIAAIELRLGAITQDSSYLINRITEHYASTRIIVDSGVYGRDPTLSGIIADLMYRIPGSSLLVVRGGERTKTLGTLRRIIAWLDSHDTRRHSQVVIIIGGGALLDVASLAVSLYRRGVDFWRVPTTLLSAIDAGIGAKSAINFYGRKNLVGTYRLPRLVIIDPVVLRTVSRRQLKSGLAEAIKLGLAADADLFGILENHFDDVINQRCQNEHGYALIHKSITSMLSQLGEDLWENELVHPTDLGHSFSRIMEQVLRPRPLHGEAVALDVAFSFACSQVQGLCEPVERLRSIRLMQRIGLPIKRSDLTVEVLKRGYEDIIIHRDGDLFPLPIAPGKTVIAPLRQTILKHAAKLSQMD